MRTRSVAVTELPLSPDQERHQRMVRYAIAMGVRMVCIVLCVFLRGWWLLLPAIGAIVLPYVAVVIANAAGASGRGAVERPGAVVRLGGSDRDAA